MLRSPDRSAPEGRLAWLVGGLAAAALACGKKPAATSAPEATAPSAGVAAPDPSAGTSGAASAASAAPAARAVVDDALRAHVSAFFAQFHDGSDYESLRASLGPRVEQFIALKDADPGRVVASVRAFFRDKQGLRYAPDLDALELEPAAGGGLVVRGPVAVSWATAPPAGLVQASLPDGGHAGPDAASGGGPLMHHDATMDVVLAWSPGGEVTRYVETRARARLLQVTDVNACSMGDLARGQSVWDLGDTLVLPDPDGSHRLRRVQTASGDAWVGDVRSWIIDSPSGTPVTGRSLCLVPAPAPGAPPQFPSDDGSDPAAAAACPDGMARLPAGSYSMSERGVPDFSRGVPGDAVGVDAFCLDVTEVTVDAFAGCVRAGRCAATHLGDQTVSGVAPTYGKDARCNYGVDGKGNHPINCVDLSDAIEYCKWKGDRLPTEEEWEWAARGGPEGRAHPWGSAKADAQLCWSGNKHKREGTCPVGSFPAGDAPGGIHDLAGNVWEMVVPLQDRIHWAAQPAPGRWSARTTSHGGGWSDPYEDQDHPLLWHAVVDDETSRSSAFGFRCARSL